MALPIMREGVVDIGILLNARHLEKGSVLSFNFGLSKEVGVKEIRLRTRC